MKEKTKTNQEKTKKHQNKCQKDQIKNHYTTCNAKGVKNQNQRRKNTIKTKPKTPKFPTLKTATMW